MTNYFLNDDGSLYLAKEIFGKRCSLPLSVKEVEELRDILNDTKKPFLENAPFDSIRVGDRVRITETYENSTFTAEITVGYVDSNYISSDDLAYETENSLAHSYTILDRTSRSYEPGDILKDDEGNLWNFNGTFWSTFGLPDYLPTVELFLNRSGLHLVTVLDPTVSE